MEGEMAINRSSFQNGIDNLLPENFQEILNNLEESEAKVKDLESTVELLLNIKREQDYSLKEAKAQASYDEKIILDFR